MIRDLVPCEILPDTKLLPWNVILQPFVPRPVLHPRRGPHYVDILEVRRGIWPESRTLLTSEEVITSDVYGHHHYSQRVPENEWRRNLSLPGGPKTQLGLSPLPDRLRSTKLGKRYFGRTQRYGVSQRRWGNDMKSWEEISETSFTSINKWQNQVKTLLPLFVIRGS